MMLRASKKLRRFPPSRGRVGRKHGSKTAWDGMMAYDEMVAQRVRQALDRRPGVTERKMFGGLAFLVRGSMCCGVFGPELVLRLGEQGAGDALRRPHTRAMDFTGKLIKSMVYVAPDGFASGATLRGWIRRAVAFASSVPPKARRPRKPRKRTGQLHRRTGARRVGANETTRAPVSER